MVKQQIKYERKFIDRFLDRFPNAHGERVAGSGTKKTSVCDVVLIKSSKSYLAEVRATKNNKYCYFGVRRDVLINTAKKCGAIPLLCVWFKRQKRYNRGKWVVVNLLKRNKWTVHIDEESLWRV